MVFISSQVVYAEPSPDTLPVGYSPVSGSSSYSVSGNTGTLVSSGPATIGNWDSFSIGSQATFNAQIEGTHLSKVTGVSPSEIFGALNVQSGQFFLVNPNGILFGSGSQVNAPGLVASTLDILENDFLAGRYNFSAPTGSNGYLLNQGKITAEPGGYIALIGRSIRNEGEISVPGAGVVMAAGDEVTVSIDGSGLVSAAVTTPVQADVYDFAGNKVSDTLSNSGSISADGGYAVLTARSTENIFDNVINHSGVISANSVQNKNGVITLTGGADQGIVRVSGDLEAFGGEIDVYGNKVGVFKDASLDVSSQVGDGGKIKMFAEDVALAYGSFSADANAPGGDGGFIETSGKKYIDTAGIRLSARAVDGDPGMWLLDPFDVTITATATSGGTFSAGTFTPSASGSNILNTDINALLNAGTAVTILTTGGGTDVGNITVNAPISKTAGANTTLTLTAAGSIFINESIISTVGTLGFIMTASAGNIIVGNTSSDTINANGGTASLTASGTINGGTTTGPRITAADISLSSGTGIGTTITFNVDTPLLSNASVSGTGDIDLDLKGTGTKTLTSVTTVNGDIDITTAESLAIGLISAGTGGTAGDVDIQTTAGSIKDTTSDTAADIIGDYITLDAVSGIGESSATGSLDINANDVTADNVTGGIFINLLTTAVPSNGLSADHAIDASLDSTGVGSIVITGTNGAGDRTISIAETFNGNINISSADGDLFASNVFSDTGIVGTNDITIQASGSASGDLSIGYLQSDDAITLTASNGSIFDIDADIQNLSAGGTVILSATGDAGKATNPIEHFSSVIPSASGVAGSSFFVVCDKFFCGSLPENPFQDAITATYSSLYSDDYGDTGTESSDGGSLADESFEEDAGTDSDKSSEESDKEGEEDEDKDEDSEDPDASTQTQTEQLKDIENDTPATENVTVSAETFNAC